MGKSFFNWFDIRNFLNTHTEWHALVEGIAEGFFLGKPRYEPTAKLLRELKKEHHYYAAGTAIGFALLIFAIAEAVALVIRAIP